LAYEIRHQREGYYVLLEANAEPGVMAELDRSLSLADEVLRHKVIRLPDRIAGRAQRPASREPSGAGPAGVVADEATTSSPRPNGA
jgi:ribosomal protein S6